MIGVIDDIIGDVAYAALDVDQCDLAEDIYGSWNTRYQHEHVISNKNLGVPLRWNCRSRIDEGAAADCGQ